MLTHLKLALIPPLLFCFRFIKKLHYWCAGIMFYYLISALVLLRFNTALLSIVFAFAISILKAFCL